METIENSSPIVETYIQEEKSDPLMGTVPKRDLYFLGQGDFRGKVYESPFNDAQDAQGLHPVVFRAFRIPADGFSGFA